MSTHRPTDLYLAGWRIASAYLYGRIDAGNDQLAIDDLGKFPDAYGVHYRDQNLSPVPNVQLVSVAYKQWQLMQTMGESEKKEIPLEKCETDG